jgi:outer membrane receptor protein involved in Fe transport
VFGEFSYDFNDQWSMTLGARWYDIEVDFEGSANSSFYNIELFGTGFTDNQRAGTNISAKYAPGGNPAGITSATTDGTIFKATLDWRPIEGQMYYVTWSEGFRPGLLNRPGGNQNQAGTFKADFFDNSFRLNAALFQVDIENLQTTIFDPSITNLFFSDNAADAEVTGLEGDFTWLPAFSERVTIGGAFSFLDTEITRVITPTNDVQRGDLRLGRARHADGVLVLQVIQRCHLDQSGRDRQLDHVEPDSRHYKRDLVT